jgi:plastocyanin
VRTVTKAAACSVAIGAIAVVAAGCGSSTTSYNAPTVTNSAIQTNSQGQTETVTTPVAAAAQGGSSPAAGCGKPTCDTTLALDTDPTQLAFVPTTLTAPAGKITINMKNDSAIQHSVAIKAPGAVAGQIVNQGQTSTATATLKAGTYQYYCTVPGHAQAGMVGTLTVTG